MVLQISAKLLIKHYLRKRGPYVYFFIGENENIDKTLVENMEITALQYSKIKVFKIEWHDYLVTQKFVKNEDIKKVFIYFNGQLKNTFFNPDLKRIHQIFKISGEFYKQNLIRIAEKRGSKVIQTAKKVKDKKLEKNITKILKNKKIEIPDSAQKPTLEHQYFTVYKKIAPKISQQRLLNFPIGINDTSNSVLKDEEIIPGIIIRGRKGEFIENFDTVKTEIGFKSNLIFNHYKTKKYRIKRKYLSRNQESVSKANNFPPVKEKWFCTIKIDDLPLEIFNEMPENETESLTGQNQYFENSGNKNLTRREIRLKHSMNHIDHNYHIPNV